MNVKLFVVLGKTTKRVVALKLPCVLGRSREADVTVAHPLISRRHCQFSEVNGLLMLRDLASLNGTMIDDRRIELAPLLPDSEFTIGPLTFRVAYLFKGDVETVPEIKYADETGGTTEAGLRDPTSAGLDDEAPSPAKPGSATVPVRSSDSSAFPMPDFMALADADPDEIPHPEPTPPPQKAPVAPTGSLWPPVANDKLPPLPVTLPPQVTDALAEPLEVDSSMQSGGHKRGESPWAAAPPPLQLPLNATPAPENEQPAHPERTPDVTSGEQPLMPPVRRKPAGGPPKKPTYGEEIDPEFGSFLEGLE